jgi:hypothetical protein
MTTLEYRNLQDILGQLNVVQLRRRFFRLITGLAAITAIVLGSLLVALPAAGLWTSQPPAALRWAILGGLAVLWAGSLFHFLLRWLFWKQNPAQIARFIEQALPEIRNDLINSVLLSRDREQASPELVELAIREAALRSAKVDIVRSISMTPLKRWGIACGLAGALMVLAGLSAPQLMNRGLAAIFSPTQYLAQVGSVKILQVDPGDASAFLGETLTITAAIDNAARKPQIAEILVEGEPAARAMMPNADNNAFTFVMDIKNDFNYAVRVGDTRWPLDKPYYHVRVLRGAQVESMTVRYEYPAYTKLPAKGPLPLTDGFIEAPVGTMATVTVTFAEPMPAAVLDVRDAGSRLPMACRNGRIFSQALDIEKDGGYRIEMQDRQGRIIQQLPDLGKDDPSAGKATTGGYYRIHAIADQPPKVVFLSPLSDVTVGPGQKVQTKLKVSDDYGLDQVQFLYGKSGSERPMTDFNARAAIDSKAAMLDYTIQIPADTPEGTEFIFYATATDKYPKAPQTTTSNKFKVTVQNMAKLAAEQSKSYEELHQRLLTLLKMQEEQRVNAEVAKVAGKVAQASDKGKEILAGQKKIRAEIQDVLDKTHFDQEMATAQQALSVLAQDEAPLAIEQATVLSTAGSLDERDNSCRLLVGTQNRIINALQALLAYLPVMMQEKSQATSRPGENLTPDVKEKLSQLSKDLQKFIDAQKKIVQSTSELAKKDVDKFTAEDEKLLKDLQAKQDDWAKFLNEKFQDLSKMAAQDFSDPVVMKELVAVKSDITMAKDALAQKSAEIATALEDNGIENAKSLTANIEKWLPDTPDRQKFSMEDPTGGQTLTEKPELPKELSDLVGDLLEQEEDMFDDMEDHTSKYNQSGDKGIGWDAADGPISNMNAQGVTGNQLPNKNEMSGRSGEGRQGKASGEYVEDKAVGKGGRRTPTRLTKEPFQKGQIKDSSAEAAGGSTGGGKVSGSGGEGLEGPVPPPLAKELERMAGKQAAILNKAQRMAPKFKQGDYANFKFLDTITLMNQVHDDLKNYRYQNALRARQTMVEHLKDTRLLLTDGQDIKTKTDTTTAMPKYIRDDIADAMHEKLPAQYKDALQQYYKKLNDQQK